MKFNSFSWEGWKTFISAQFSQQRPLRPYLRSAWVEVDSDSLVFQSSVLTMNTHIRREIMALLQMRCEEIRMVLVRTCQKGSLQHSFLYIYIYICVCVEFYAKKLIIPPTCPAPVLLELFCLCYGDFPGSNYEMISSVCGTACTPL